MKAGNFFYSPGGKRLRLVWRILIFIGLYFSFVFLLGLPAYALELLGEQTTARSVLASQVINILALGGAVYLARVYFDKKSLESLGLAPDGMWADLAAGIGISALMMGLIFTVFSAAGWLEFENFIWQVEGLSTWGLRLFTMFLAFIFVGVAEEVLFRGYLFKNLVESMDLGWAVAISSLVFALLHLTNPGGMALFPVLGLFLAGLFFAYAVILRGSLWLAIGLHIGWNFFENSVFGFPVSGLRTPGLLVHRVTGPELWTGGAFGPEAGLALVPALGLGLLLIWAYCRKAGRIS